MDKTIGFVITAGHLDIEWYQPMRSFRFWTMEIMADLKKIAKEQPDFRNYLLDGQVFPLEDYLKLVPTDEAPLKELVRTGLLAIGPFYTQFDEWLPSAESMIRNCLYGRIKCEKLGGRMNAGYLPDNFGHPLQMPQILNNFGLDSLMFMRGMPEIEGGHPDEFIYRGPDGSEVLASHFREGYGGAFDLYDKDVDPIQPRTVPYCSDGLSYEWHRELARHEDPEEIAAKLVRNVLDIVHRYPSGIVPLISGCDHLPPQAGIGACIRLANQQQQEISFVWGTPEEYALAVHSRLKEPAVFDMELIGSKYQYILFGALSTRTYLKRQNFAAEALVERYAEPLTTIAARYGLADQQRLLDEAWTCLMINSAHDSIHGSSVDEVHVEMEARSAAVRQIAGGLVHMALKHIAGQFVPWWKQQNRAFLAYSPVGASHWQPCELWAAIGNEQVVVMDRAGKCLPTQILPREAVFDNDIGLPRNDRFPSDVYRKVLFLDQFRQGGLNGYTLVPSAGDLPVESVSVERESNRKNVPQHAGIMTGIIREARTNDACDLFMENESLRVESHGALVSMLDKRSGHWTHNLNLLEEEADAGDAWDFSPPWSKGETVHSTRSKFACSMKESGAVRSVMEARGKLCVPDHLEGDKRSEQRTEMDVVFEITLYRGIARVDVALKLDNTAKDHRVRLSVPMGLQAKTVRTQGHLAILDRPIARPTEIEPWLQPPSQLLPFREWLSVDNGSQGLAIAFKGVYDYEAILNPLNQEPEIGFTLVRGIGMMGRTNTLQRKGPASWAHDTPGAQCLGQQVIEWSYLPFQVVPDEKSPFLPTAQSFLFPAVSHVIRLDDPAQGTCESIGLPVHWEERNLCFSAFKQSVDMTGHILRIYENQGKSTSAVLHVSGYTKVYLINMNEEIMRELPLDADLVKVDFAPYKCLSFLLVANGASST